MRGTTLGLIAIACLFGLAGTLFAAEPIKLAVGGKSTYVIVVGEKADATERFAAEELQKYIEKISGAKLTISADAGESPFIAIGECSGMDVPSRYEGDDAYRIRSVDSNLLLKGATPRGTLYAVYDLLERLGCYWLSPDFKAMKGHSEYVPNKPTIGIEPIDALEQPLMKYRERDPGSYYAPNSWNAVFDFMSKTRANTIALNRSEYEKSRAQIRAELEKRGVWLEIGKHNTMPDFLPQENHFAEHPEWFGMIDGKRTDHFGVVFETANPDAVARFTINLIDYLKTRPEVDVYQIWPPDGCKWSESPESLKIGPPSERMALLIQHVSKAVKAASLKTRISFLAYEHIIEPPKNMAYDKDTIVDFCPISRDYSQPLDGASRPENIRLNNALLGWTKGFPGEVVHYSYYAKGSWSSLPVVEPEQIASDTKYWKRIGECGTDIYCQSGDWLAREANHLSFARASWDANFDAAKWYDEYLKMRFGAAADAMKRYYKLATQISLWGLIPQSTQGQPQDYYPQLAEARKAMAEAIAKADTPEAKWAIGILSWQPDYLASALEVRQLEVDRKPMTEITAARQKLVKLFNSHLGDGSANGKPVNR